MEEQNIGYIPWVWIEAKVSGFVIIIILVIITTTSTVIIVVSDEGKEQRSRGISL